MADRVKSSAGRFISAKKGEKNRNFEEIKRKRRRTEDEEHDVDDSADDADGGGDDLHQTLTVTGPPTPGPPTSLPPAHTVDVIDQDALDIDSESEIDNGSVNVNDTWTSGRRVVHLGVLAQGLKQCQICHQPLNLINCIGEKRFGLASHLYVKCTNMQCELVNTIPTASRTGRGPFDVNVKAAAAILDAGSGERQFNKILANLNVPPVHHKTLKKREREVGPLIEEVAVSSCLEAQKKEHQASLGKSTESDETQDSVSYDAGWQKRGTGRQYDSLTSHGVMVGDEEKEVVMYSVSCKTCRICEAAAKKNEQPRVHSCRKNWTGSAKAMEPAMAVDMLHKMETTGFNVGTIIMDGDSTTISRIQSDVDAIMKKKMDENHFKKGIIGALYNMSNQHKTLKNQTVRSYIVRCIMYAVKQHQDDPSGLSAALKTAVPHIYGEHTGCNPRWCHHIGNPDFRYRSLPHGRALQDVALRSALNKMVDRYITQCEQLAHLGSTQACESFHNMVASRAPKARFYGGSESLCYRVSCTVAQKNIGHLYMTKVNRKLGLSPGCYTSLHALRLDRVHKARKARQNTKDHKKERLLKKTKRAGASRTAEVCEGDTYQSGIGLDGDTVPSLETISFPEASDNIVFFDLETTGLARTAEIVQIAAVSSSRQFSRYIMPIGPISAGATKVTGLAVRNNRLYYHNTEVATCTLHEALVSFLDFVKLSPSRPVLAGHNIASYDCPVLLHSLHQCKMVPAMAEAVTGCLDTFLLAKRKFPKPSTVSSHRQSVLVKELLGKDYSAHNALSDVLALQELYEARLSLTKVEMVMEVFDLLACQHRVSLDPLVAAGAISKTVQIKLARSGLGLGKLTLAYKRDPELGVRSLLSALVSGKPRITKNKRVVDKLCTHLSQNSAK